MDVAWNATRSLWPAGPGLPAVPQPQGPLLDPGRALRQIWSSLFCPARASLLRRVGRPRAHPASLRQVRVRRQSPALPHARDHGRLRAHLRRGRPLEMPAEVHRRVHAEVRIDEF